MLELRNSSYLRIEGLVIDGRGMRDVDGIKTVVAGPATWDTDAVHHVDIVGVTIHDVSLDSAVGISTKCTTWDIEVRDCRIYDIRTGLCIGNLKGGGLRERYPEASERELQLRLASIRLGPQVLREVCGLEPYDD